MEFNINKQLIYQDSHLIILNKPSGLRVIQDGYNPELPNLKKYMQEIFGEVYVVHRLDKDTSGILLMALDKETHKIINNQFSNRLINKKYMSICMNIPQWKFLRYQSTIKVNGDRKHRTVHHPQGKLSKTDFFVLRSDQSNNRSIIISALKTGYTHQIRSHLSFLGFPILCDPLYKNIRALHEQEISCPIERLALHALKIVFYHPYLQQRLCFEAPIPEDIKSLMV